MDDVIPALGTSQLGERTVNRPWYSGVANAVTEEGALLCGSAKRLCRGQLGGDENIPWRR